MRTLTLGRNFTCTYRHFCSGDSIQSANFHTLGQSDVRIGNLRSRKHPRRLETHWLLASFSGEYGRFDQTCQRTCESLVAEISHEIFKFRRPLAGSESNREFIQYSS